MGGTFYGEDFLLTYIQYNSKHVFLKIYFSKKIHYIFFKTEK